MARRLKCLSMAALFYITTGMNLEQGLRNLRHHQSWLSAKFVVPMTGMVIASRAATEDKKTQTTFAFTFFPDDGCVETLQVVKDIGVQLQEDNSREGLLELSIADLAPLFLEGRISGEQGDHFVFFETKSSNIIPRLSNVNSIFINLRGVGLAEFPLSGFGDAWQEAKNTCLSFRHQQSKKHKFTEDSQKSPRLRYLTEEDWERANGSIIQKDFAQPNRLDTTPGTLPQDPPKLQSANDSDLADGYDAAATKDNNFSKDTLGWLIVILIVFFLPGVLQRLRLWRPHLNVRGPREDSKWDNIDEDTIDEKLFSREQKRKNTEDHYKSVLEIEGAVTPQVVRRQYKIMASKYHPDKVSHLGVRLRSVAEQEMKEINAAYKYFQKKYRIP